jgi:acetoin utilization protein AcuB
MPIPAVSHYMQKQPITIERTASLAEAHRVMRQYQIRHLPVLDRDNLVGVVSQRDLHLLESVGEADVENSKVDEAMTEHPFIVTSDTALDEVLDIMADHKYGSVIVMGRAGVEGIFTANTRAACSRTCCATRPACRWSITRPDRSADGC